jgi:hypothetical protein
MSSSSSSSPDFTGQSVFFRGLNRSRVFRPLPQAIVDIVFNYAQFFEVKGEYLCSFRISPNEHIVPYQCAGVDDPDIGFITQYCSGYTSIFTFYNISGDVMKEIKVESPLSTSSKQQSQFLASPTSLPPRPSLIPRNLDSTASYTFFKPELGLVWADHYSGVCDFFLAGKTREPFTNWINEKNNVIHLGGCDYPLKLPGWVSNVSYRCVCVTGEYIYLFCRVRERKTRFSALFHTSPSRLCLFTLKGEFVKFIFEYNDAHHHFEDFVVTKNQEIFMLKRMEEMASYKLVRYTLSTGALLETIDIDGCDFWKARLTQLRSGHLAIALYSDHMWDTKVQIFG